MRTRFTLSALLAATLALVAGCRPGADLDPDAIYRVRGQLLAEDGTPAADTELRVFLLDRGPEAWDDTLLHTLDVLGYPNLVATPSFVTQSDGTFMIELPGEDLIDVTGERVLAFSVVYQEGGSPFAFMATATPWDRFYTGDEERDVGVLRLWDAGVPGQATREWAEQIDGELVFDWSKNPAPPGFEPAVDTPTFLYALDAGDNLRWADRSLTGKVRIPRGAFAASLATSPDYFLTTVSEETDGVRRYLHRTRLRTHESRPIANWSTTAPDVNLLDPTINMDARLVDAAGVPLGSAATDGSFTSGHEFLGDEGEVFYIDLGDVYAFRDVLVFHAKVEGLGDGTLELSVSSEAGEEVPAAQSFTLLAHLQRPAADVDWVFFGYAGGGQGRWLELRATDGARFAMVRELMVKAVTP